MEQYRERQRLEGGGGGTEPTATLRLRVQQASLRSFASDLLVRM